jgi:hypothetical protein
MSSKLCFFGTSFSGAEYIVFIDSMTVNKSVKTVEGSHCGPFKAVSEQRPGGSEDNHGKTGKAVPVLLIKRHAIKTSGSVCIDQHILNLGSS